MKSIRSKIILLVVGCVVVSSVAIGVMSFFNARHVVLQDSKQIMNLLCENKSENFNETFKRIEQSVETLAIYVDQEVSNAIESLQTTQEFDEFSEHMLPTTLAAAQNTENVISVYFRFDPTFSSTPSGLFYTVDDDGSFKKEEPTDLTKYEEDDTAHVGWFYGAKNTGKPTWLPPYYNENIGVEMISYVVPLYYQETFIGVVGMDIDFEHIKNVVSGTKVYDSGYAFLTDDKAHIVYHKELKSGTNLIDYNQGEFKSMAKALLKESKENDELIDYSYGGIYKQATFQSLENGMRFIVSAPTDEIDEQANALLSQILMGSFVILFITILLVYAFSKRLVHPLAELTSAAKEIANGDLSVTITHHSKDEVGVLSEALRQTIAQLRKSFDKINALAYIDYLTGTKNKTAYMEHVFDIEEKMKQESVRFSVIVFDLNDLKIVNDTLGHDAGDGFILHATKIIQDSFQGFPLYRIGGDEFVVVIENQTIHKEREMLSLYLEKIEEYNFGQGNVKISIAYGVASYESGVDNSFKDVFKRADNEMYECKQKMKGKK
ncbi:sensor domain-containing diguanylate cyclase [Amedibacillus sp. YH-ame6]